MRSCGTCLYCQPEKTLESSVKKLHHAMEKLGPHPAAFRAIIHFALHPLNRTLLRRAEALPPRRQRIDDEIARLRGTAEGHIQLRRVFIDDPTRDIFWSLANSAHGPRRCSSN